MSPASLALDACVSVLRDTGLTAADVDGIVGSTPPAAVVQSALGIPEVTWFANPQIPFVNQLVAAVGAVYSGQCDVVLGYHASFRGPMFSRSAAERSVPAAAVASAPGSCPRHRRRSPARWATPRGRRATPRVRRRT